MGGSPRTWRSVSTPEPTRSDAYQLTPSPTVPATSSEDPPPMSTTPTVPAGGSSSVAVAPANASRASSASSSTRIGRPASRSTAAHSAARLTAWRIAAVATACTRSAPQSRATAAWAATTDASTAIVSASISPRVPGTSGTNMRRASNSRRPAPARSATSSRVVFEPISMHAPRIGCHHLRR